MRPQLLSLAALCACAAPLASPPGADGSGLERRHELVHVGGSPWRREPPLGNDAALPLVGPLVTPAQPFEDVLASWNVEVDPGAGFEVELRLFEGERASPWLFLGTFGAGDARTRPRRTAFAGGAVDVDAFAGAPGRRFESVQLRLLALGDVRPVRASFCFTSSRPRAPEGAPMPGDVARVVAPLDVPARSQREEDASIAARICSPTSLAMVLAQHGADVATAEVARRAYDPLHDLYGNWPRATQTAFSFGVPGYVTRFDGWAPVEELVARGLPVIISLRLGKGELRGAPYASTAGHLIVVRGFDERGGVLVNDPAAPTAASVPRRYDRAELGRAWLGHGGVAYVLDPPTR